MGALGTGYPLVSTGNVFTAIDTFASTQQNNGALNPIGTVACIPLPQGQISPNKGGGSYLWCKYVQYKSTANPAVVGGPAPVYYVDETYTIVSGVFSEGNPAATGNANSIAGWLLPNTVSVSGFTAAQLNTNFVWIGLAGYIPGCSVVASTAIGDALIGATGNFVNARVASGTAPTFKPLGFALTAIASGLADVQACVQIF